MEAALRTIVILGISLAALVPVVAMSSASPVDQPDIAGYWLTAERDSIIQVGRCGSTVCGIVRSYVGPSGETDRANPDATRRKQPICGLRIVGGLVPAGPGWGTGWLYDPESGSRYGLTVKSVSAQKLRLRAFLGIEAIGEDVTWTRSAKVPKTCSDV
jgi:uncharacterized protein (DUF2147 family)